jgi:hypothetical protein
VGRPLAALGLSAALLFVWLFVHDARGPGAAEPPRAYELQPLPARVDSLVPLDEAAKQVLACRGECRAAIYLWTPRMPLSRAGIPHVVRAAERLGIELALVAHEDLGSWAAGAAAEPGASVEDALLASGALAHAPALVLFAGGEPVGPAILGYKSGAAYEALLSRRAKTARPATGMGDPEPEAFPRAPATSAPAAAAALELVDYEAVGLPGAYFRWVPRWNALAYESNQRIYLLDLATGQNRRAPGFIDFVPTPDGGYFVTPGPGEGGLEFYDADDVFDAAGSGRIGEVEPIFTDLRMRDQYPSVGILERNETRTLYRVLTSWFDAVIYRDYDVRVDARTGVASVRPVGEPVRPCVSYALSTPIMSQDGRELAARDEATGTTKIFRILEGGRCEALTDLGVPTSKVAWHAGGRLIAFSIPRRGRDNEDGARGIFVLDRKGPSLRHVSGSEVASRLAFPEFVGEEALVYLVPGETLRDASLFRVVPIPR